MRKPSWEADFVAFYHARSRSLRRTAYAMCGDWALTDDLVQHTFTRLYTHWPRIKNDRPDGYARRTLVPDRPRHRRGSAPDAARAGRGGPEQPDVDAGYQQIADRVETVTRSHLPGIEPRTDDIYPSDWTRDTALPEQRWEDATEWHGLFTVAAAAGDQDLWVSAMYMPAGDRPSLASDRAYCDRQQSTRCEVDGTANAWTTIDEMLSSADGVNTYWLRVRAARDGGAYSNLVRIGLRTSSLQQARELWAVDAAQLRAIATDPDLAIPRPAAWPPPPHGD